MATGRPLYPNLTIDPQKRTADTCLDTALNFSRAPAPPHLHQQAHSWTTVPVSMAHSQPATRHDARPSSRVKSAQQAHTTTTETVSMRTCNLHSRIAQPEIRYKLQVDTTCAPVSRVRAACRSHPPTCKQKHNMHACIKCHECHLQFPFDCQSVDTISSTHNMPASVSCARSKRGGGPCSGPW